ncbi:class I SAM-dependent methyltransferase [Bradyrhizobium sp. BRP20]|uniref:class I SAM-dependent methyltransferase n=1 Tax=unclassified Bradyrhizobium TaxID=2631580 RepID=UPI001CD5E278|nr:MULTISPECIES: class I SAM-dependent methyltransferase [unclassified Bradyrhizobium]MCA1437966.1 class I SAM-dependent methyltransferase [Bradyrhizobium sp. BRP20]MCA1552136.1 class I SAM-dependent methyltransferase [Bradyrhizobium sp. BRP19]
MPSQSVDAHSAYTGLADAYDSYRPHYPDELVSFIAERVMPAGLCALSVLDVGSGTGLFTRQLASLLPPSASITGLEPNADMRRNAICGSAGILNIKHMPGRAERLPAESGTISLVTAASAATWFDRPKFYTEANRVLTPSGLIAVLMIRRDLDRSEMLRDYERYHERYIRGFVIGGFEDSDGRYAPVNFVHELKSSPLFRKVRHFALYWDDFLTWEQFEGLSLSRSDTKKIIEINGLEDTMRWHRLLFERYAAMDGTVEFPWSAEVTIALPVAQ